MTPVNNTRLPELGDKKIDSAHSRALTAIRTLCGPAIIAALEEPTTVELMVNADGVVWQERLGEPAPVSIGHMNMMTAREIINKVASLLGLEAKPETPIIEGNWPLDGSRFAGQIPPIVGAPTFAIRKKASSIFTLDQYVSAGIMTPEQRAALVESVKNHHNILIAGGTGSGKTTLVNALIAESVRLFPNERVLTVEDTAELQCSAANMNSYYANKVTTQSDIIKAMLRMRPDRIHVGEMRDHAANDLLVAWNTGHEGGFATVHANDPISALDKVVMLVSMHPFAPRNYIDKFVCQVIHRIVHISRVEGGGRKVRSIAAVVGRGSGGESYRVSGVA